MIGCTITLMPKKKKFNFREYKEVIRFEPTKADPLEL
jgi:hypothetical protein